jgi:hypothetical protein
MTIGGTNQPLMACLLCRMVLFKPGAARVGSLGVQSRAKLFPLGLGASESTADSPTCPGRQWGLEAPVLHAAARQCRGAPLRLVGDHRLGRDEQAGDRGGTLQC